MSTINKTVLERFFEEIYIQGNLTAADELVAADYVSHDPAPGEAPGREGLKAFVAYLRRAFADLHVTIEAQVAEGDRVATRYTICAAGRRASLPAFPRPANSSPSPPRACTASPAAASRKAGSTGTCWGWYSSWRQRSWFDNEQMHPPYREMKKTTNPEAN